MKSIFMCAIDRWLRSDNRPPMLVGEKDTLDMRALPYFFAYQEIALEMLEAQ